MNRAFEKFCREHYVRDDGQIERVNSNSPAARKHRRQKYLKDLTNRKTKKMRRVDDLYSQARKLRESADNNIYLEKVKPIMEEAAALRDEVAEIQKQIARITKGK